MPAKPYTATKQPPAPLELEIPDMFLTSTPPERNTCSSATSSQKEKPHVFTIEDSSYPGEEMMSKSAFEEALKADPVPAKRGALKKHALARRDAVSDEPSLLCSIGALKMTRPKDGERAYIQVKVFDCAESKGSWKHLVTTYKSKGANFFDVCTVRGFVLNNGVFANNSILFN